MHDFVLHYFYNKCTTQAKSALNVNVFVPNNSQYSDRHYCGISHKVYPNGCGTRSKYGRLMTRIRILASRAIVSFNFDWLLKVLNDTRNCGVHTSRKKRYRCIDGYTQNPKCRLSLGRHLFLSTNHTICRHNLLSVPRMTTYTLS